MSPIVDAIEGNFLPTHVKSKPLSVSENLYDTFKIEKI